MIETAIENPPEQFKDRFQFIGQTRQVVSPPMLQAHRDMTCHDPIPTLNPNLTTKYIPGRISKNLSSILWALLQWCSFPAIIDTKNKNAAACGCANTRRPAQVLRPPTQRPFGRTAWNIIRQARLFCKGWFLPYLFPAHVLHKSFASYAV